MTGFNQTISDLKLIASTDKRVWAATAFLVVVSTVWLVTGSWRELDTNAPVELVNVRVDDSEIESMIQTFNQDLKEGEEERAYLKDYLGRFTNELKVNKKDMDWQVNILVNKLDTITEKVDGLANKVGASSISSAKLNEKFKKKKRVRKIIQVDRSLL